MNAATNAAAKPATNAKASANANASVPSLDARSTERALPWPELVEALRTMLVRRHTGQTRSPERIAMPLPGGVLLAMPATDGEFACTKLATLHDGNPARGLPTLIGEAILIRAGTGELLARFDAAAITARRTAALSALAALALCGPRRERLLVFGSGVQARAHVDALRATLPLREVAIHSRTPAHARALAQEIDAADPPCVCIESAPSIADYDIVVTATPSREPLFDDAPHFDGFVAAIGAYRPEMCELPSALLQRAAIFADDIQAARGEAGDLLRAKVDWARVVALEHVVAGDAKAPERGPIVFKSVGQALWDLAACRLAWTRLQQEDAQ
ncbi:MAG: delta(1)-pyrroline-2-carboxylate reductase family protein [Burkholderiaceae bacterium]|nr:delta(1)-pyrroline-2-carboxylate reductase family protein [Burkholderiaceae bacterium]